MKKTILLATALLPGALFSQNIPTELYVSAGGYHNRDCRGGAGICRESTVTPSVNKTNAIIRKHTDQSLELSIHTSDFTELELKQILMEMIFSIGENTIIDELILTELKISPDLTIVKSGDYPITLKNDRFDVILLLANK